LRRARNSAMGSVPPLAAAPGGSEAASGFFYNEHMKLGVRLESLGLPLRPALTATAKMGAAGVQVDAAGDLSPERLSQTGRRELGNLLRSHNLQLTALGCPLRRG